MEAATAATAKTKERTRYRYFKKVEQDTETDSPATVETRDLYELLPGKFESVRAAHAKHGDGVYVAVPLRSFSPATLKSETVTKLIVA